MAQHGVTSSWKIRVGECLDYMGLWGICFASLHMFPVLGRRKTHNLFKTVTEIIRIVVTHLSRDLIDLHRGMLEKLLGPLDTSFGEVIDEILAGALRK